ncbi:putative amino acid transporter, transmembrane domain-containing protein [Helianthus anomalus]
MFGNKISDNVLISLHDPTWLIIMANVFVVLHVIGGYQMYAIPVFDMIESVLVRKFNFALVLSCGLSPGICMLVCVLL